MLITPVPKIPDIGEIRNLAGVVVDLNANQYTTTSLFFVVDQIGLACCGGLGNIVN